jgi:hypothetical protein
MSRSSAAAALPKVIGAGGSLLITAVFARPLPVPVIKRVTEPARRQNASKCHEQGNDKRCPQNHRVYHDGVLFLLCCRRAACPTPAPSSRHRTSAPARPDRVRCGDCRPCSGPRTGLAPRRRCRASPAGRNRVSPSPSPGRGAWRLGWRFAWLARGGLVRRRRLGFAHGHRPDHPFHFPYPERLHRLVRNQPGRHRTPPHRRRRPARGGS